MKLALAVALMWSVSAFAGAGGDPCCDIEDASEVVITSADCQKGLVALKLGENDYYFLGADLGVCESFRKEHARALSCTAVRAQIVVEKVRSLWHPLGQNTITKIKNARDIDGACL